MSDFEWRYPPVKVDWPSDNQISAYYIEGWQYGQSSGHATLRRDIEQGYLTSREDILKWIKQKHPFDASLPMDHCSGPCTGGLRLLVFDRTHFSPLAITIDEQSVNELIKQFHLVPETIPVLLTAEGGMRYRFQRKGQSNAKSLQLLMQSNQILKVANFMISLSYDFETKWTTAIACVENEDKDGPVGERLGFVVNAIEHNQALWAHPTFLPTVFATHYSDEMRESRSILRGDITNINRRLGVSTARSFRPEGLPEDWPENLDFRWLITNLHARRVEIMQVREGCKWSCKSLGWLRDLEGEIRKENEGKGEGEGELGHNMQQVLEYHLSIIEGTEGRFATLQEESEASTNMLFNAITQRDSIIAQRYNDIARKIATSTKEDSISMSTFTFITALFLPGTFMATFLSITMIDWQPGSLGDSGKSGGASIASTQVSKYYWVFWAIDIPLTVFVLLGWWVWFRHAKKTWVRENGIMLNRDVSKSSIVPSSDSIYRMPRKRPDDDSFLMGNENQRSRRTLSIRTEASSGEEGNGESISDRDCSRIRHSRKRQIHPSLLPNRKLSRPGCKSAQRGRQEEDDAGERKELRKDGDCKNLDEKENGPASPTGLLAAGLRDRLAGTRQANLRRREDEEDVEMGNGRLAKSSE